MNQSIFETVKTFISATPPESHSKHSSRSKIRSAAATLVYRKTYIIQYLGSADHNSIQFQKQTHSEFSSHLPFHCKPFGGSERNAIDSNLSAEREDIAPTPPVTCNLDPKHLKTHGATRRTDLSAR
ncbi:hypothetical protein Mapa_003998 [Marchantia paleacea]|nr:hypothetical protein Mapa_003998 [Marchantia paleacea]